MLRSNASVGEASSTYCSVEEVFEFIVGQGVLFAAIVYRVLVPH